MYLFLLKKKKEKKNRGNSHWASFTEMSNVKRELREDLSIYWTSVCSLSVICKHTDTHANTRTHTYKIEIVNELVHNTMNLKKNKYTHTHTCMYNNRWREIILKIKFSMRSYSYYVHVYILINNQSTYTHNYNCYNFKPIN